MDVHTFALLYKSLVRTPVEHAVSVWCPIKRRHWRDWKKTQKKAT